MEKRGFSLIEVLVTAALVFFLLTATAQVIILSCAAQKKADFLLTAASAASAKLEQLKSLPFDSPELEAGLHADTVIINDSPAAFLREWDVEDTAGNMKKVVLKVSSSGHPGKKATFLLLVSRELEF